MNKTKSTGFTLIELMIVVAIIGIIAAIAYPSYMDQVTKAKRSDGQSKLLDAMARQERYYSENNTYTVTMTDLGYAANPVPSDEGHYNIAGAACGGGITQCVVLTATPTFTDALCGNLTYNSTNTKTESGSGTTDNCW
jgi:type IV pilus assembly protein PilE